MVRFACLTSLTVALLLAGCALVAGRQPEGLLANAEAEPVVDPVGVYDVTMSSGSQVSEGTIEIRGKPGNYRGTLVVGVMLVVIEGVETGAGIIQLRVDMPMGTLVLRLAGEGGCFSGNWVLDAQRGTVVSQKRAETAGVSAGC